MPIRIVLADDHAIIREGLRILLQKEPDITVVGEAGTGREAVDLVRRLRPDLLVVDIGMPDLNGIEATRQVRRLAPMVKVLALSVHADERFVWEALRAGASGYVRKDCGLADLVRAIRQVMAGQTAVVPLNDRIAAYLASRGGLPPEPPACSVLTPREREVVQLLAEGKSTKEAALRLHLSPKTVETHRQHIMEKVHANSIAELTKYALREGLTSLDS